MATITGMTAARMLAIEAESITAARVDPATFHLILTTHGGTDIDVGSVRGAVGPMNPNAADLTDVGVQTFAGEVDAAALGATGGIVKGAPAGALFLNGDSAVDVNYNNGSIGSFQFFGGGVSSVFSVDHLGNMRVAENLFVNTAGSSLCIGGMAGGTNPCIYNDGSGNIVLQIAGAGHAVKTNNNILDDGAGNVSIAGDLRLIGASSNIKTSSNSVTFQDANGHGFLGAYDDGAGGGTNLYTIRGGAVGNMLDDGSGHIRATAQIYPGSEALVGQTSGGLLHAAGVPANANGNNNDWCISDNGHLYFKAAGAWVQKI